MFGTVLWRRGNIFEDEREVVLVWRVAYVYNYSRLLTRAAYYLVFKRKLRVLSLKIIQLMSKVVLALFTSYRNVRYGSSVKAISARERSECDYIEEGAQPNCRNNTFQ